MKSASPSTWMPLYIGDYLADTMHLDAEEHGAYLMLIMHYWKHGPIPNDANRLQQIARIKPSRVSSKIMSTVLQFFDIQDGFLRHSRIDEELSSALENIDKQKKRTEAATAARAANKSNVTNNVTSTATFTPSPSPSPLSTSSEGKEPSSEVPAEQGSRVPLFEKEDLPEKEVFKMPTYPEDFEAFWQAYPPERRKEKPKAHEAWKAAKRKAPVEKIMEALDAYKRTAEVTDGFSPYPAKWLKTERFLEDFTTTATEGKPSWLS